jgi:hypothetical protein
MLGAGVYGLRTDSIFACRANGYGLDWYLAYCQAAGFGDYEHGAFWFELERGVSDAATNADVLFLGNSRAQFGFSTDATARWFSSPAASHYLLGFSYYETYLFESALLRRIRPHAKVYVINLDEFFEPTESVPARMVMQDRESETRYERKRRWQRVHRVICGSLPKVCGDERVIFRSRATGAWLGEGGRSHSLPVSYGDAVDRAMEDRYTSTGRDFLATLSVNRECVILTFVPKPGSGIGTAKTIAAALGVPFVAPELEGLRTFDGSHLDRESAERWSIAFFEAAGPQIRTCLDQPRVSSP